MRFEEPWAESRLSTDTPSLVPRRAKPAYWPYERVSPGSVTFDTNEVDTGLVGARGVKRHP